MLSLRAHRNVNVLREDTPNPPPRQGSGLPTTPNEAIHSSLFQSNNNRLRWRKRAGAGGEGDCLLARENRDTLEGGAAQHDTAPGVAIAMTVRHAASLALFTGHRRRAQGPRDLWEADLAALSWPAWLSSTTATTPLRKSGKTYKGRIASHCAV